MATPRRQPRPATENEALRAKLATMTYSFARQLPQLSSHTPPPPPHNPQTTTPDDPNFPKLTSQPVYSQTNRTGNLPRAWDAAKRPPTPGRPPRWANGQGKPATAAEVVASAPSDTSAQSEEAAESEKQEAELALYSKLVPTTSAVPRNPGSLLGGGGLRATGSVVAQKSSRPTTGTALHTPQPLPSLTRKEPMVSRMRNLSSDASKPQLARRVAKLNRSASATPPPAPSVPSSASSSASVDGMESETTIDDELEKTGIVTLPSIMKKDDVSHLRNMSREGSPLSASRQTLSPAVQRQQRDSHESKVACTSTRRLDEAFLKRNGTDTGTGIGTANGRNPPLSTSRRSPGLSPPPGHRKGKVKDGQGRNGGWVSKETSESTVPPGFEGRSATVSRSPFTRSRTCRSEPESAHSSKSFERGNPPIRPKNARADALREAINSRRRSSSPRTLHSSRNHGESISGANDSEPILATSNAMRKRSEREMPRSRKTEDDFKRCLQSSSSRELEAGLSKPGITRQRLSPTANPGRQREPSDRKGDPVSSGPRTHGRTKVGSLGHGKEQGSISGNYRRKTPMNAKTEGPVNTTSIMSSGLSTNAVANGVRQMYDECSEKILTTVPQLQAPYPTCYQNGCSDHSSAHEGRSDWHDTVNDIGVGGGGREPFVDNLFETSTDDTARFSHSSSFANSEQNVSSSGLSMIDAVSSFHGNDGEPGSKNHVERMDDVVLPPLPNSEDVGFESLLRSMGWTPPDEDEGPKNFQNHAARIVRNSEDDETFRGGAPGHNSGLETRKTENRNTGSGFYSHFQ